MTSSATDEDARVAAESAEIAVPESDLAAELAAANERIKVLEAARDTARDEALEEAAKVAEGMTTITREYTDEITGDGRGKALIDPSKIAAAIRALKSSMNNDLEEVAKFYDEFEDHSAAAQVRALKKDTR
jgi:hypothetical protein